MQSDTSAPCQGSTESAFSGLEVETPPRKPQDPANPLDVDLLPLSFKIRLRDFMFGEAAEKTPRFLERRSPGRVSLPCSAGP